MSPPGTPKLPAGRYARPRGVPRALGVVMGGALAAAAVAFVLWAAAHHATPPVGHGVLGYTVASNHLAKVRFEVATESPDSTVACVVSALNGQHQEVGRKEVTVSVGQSPVTHSEVLRTTERPVTVTVGECRVVAGP
ncbi:MAG: DUF4307 domain-containing protein [Carbonactinosporaceae bacterium]